MKFDNAAKRLPEIPYQSRKAPLPEDVSSHKAQNLENDEKQREKLLQVRTTRNTGWKPVTEPFYIERS